MIGEKYVQIDKIKIDVDTGKFRYKNKDFTKGFDMNKIAYSDAKNNYYAFDFDSGEQLTFNAKGLPEKVTIDDLDVYVNRHIISDLVAGLEDNKKGKGQWMMLIIGVILGLAIGVIIGQQLAGSMATTPNPTNTPLPEIIKGLMQ